MINTCCAQGVIGIGPTNTGVMGIGIAPGEHEVKTKQPFTGPSGKLLDADLYAVEWPRDQVYLTNTICSFNNEPTPEQLLACRPRLSFEIAACAAEAPDSKLLIVTFGKIASEYIWHLPFGKTRGALLNMTDRFNAEFRALGLTYTCDQVIGLPTFHPSGILQSSKEPEKQTQMATSLVLDLQKIKWLKHGIIAHNGIAKLDQGHIAFNNPNDRNFEVVIDSNKAQAILDSIDLSYSIVLDIETDYDKEAELSDPYGNILCVGIRATIKEGKAGNRQIFVFTQSALKDLMWPQANYIGHNLYGFDAVAMQVKYGVNLPIAGDTYIKSYVWDERTTRGTHKLKNRSRELLGAGFYEDEREHSAGLNLYTYNANDVYYTDELDNFLSSQLDDNDKRLYHDLLLPAATMYSQAQVQGVSIDRVKLAELSVDFIQRASKLESRLQQEAASQGCYAPNVKGKGAYIELSSPQQLLLYLKAYRKHKHLTSTAKDVLEPLSDQDPWIAGLLEHRRLTKAYAVYCLGVMNQIKFDGKAHPKCLIPGTRTGRPSYHDPPVNTLPHARSVGELSKVRSIFIPDDDEHTLVELDYNSIELFILQHLSQDLNMLADLRDPWHITNKPNYHSRTCERDIKGVPCPVHAPYGKDDPTCATCVKWAFDRDNSKHVNFGIAYGETAYGLTRPSPIGTGQDLKTCQTYIDNWYAWNKDVYRWQIKIQEQVAREGFISTVTGRKCRMPAVLNKRQLRQVINFPIQSEGSDTTLTAALELVNNQDFRSYDSRLLWTTYDSILLHVSKKYLEQVIALAVHIMTKPRFPDYPGIEVEYAQGDNLYEVHS